MNIVFKGVNSNSLNIVFSNFIAIPVPTRTIEKVKIPGKIEYLTINNQNIEPIILSIEGVALTSDLLSLRKFFSGSGDLILSNYPEYIFKATISQEVMLKPDLEDTIDIFGSFECQPVIYLKQGKAMQTFNSSVVTINNIGTTESNPIINVYGNGKIVLKQEGKKILEINNVSQKVTINSELDSIYKDSTSMERQSVGSTPKLKVGVNTLFFEGNVSKIEIVPNWRIL